MTHLTRRILIGLSFVIAGASSFATTLTLQSNFNIAGGGGFSGQLSGSATALQVYCVDFNNEANVQGPYAVNVSTAANLSNALYGTAQQSAFALQVSPDGTALGNAATRYAQAAWLITQYDHSAGANNGAKDIGIQNAIWDLLSVDQNHKQTQGDWQVWLNSAAGHSNFTGFTVYTTTRVAGMIGDSRYSQGNQEMISIDPSEGPTGPTGPATTPEPNSAVLLAIGFAALGLGVLRRCQPAGA